MTTNPPSFTDLSDHHLLAAVQRLAGDERRATAQLVASLAELDARRLYLGEGCSSLFTYCTQVLHLSEHAASREEPPRPPRRRLIRDHVFGAEDAGVPVARTVHVIPFSTRNGEHRPRSPKSQCQR